MGELQAAQGGFADRPFVTGVLEGYQTMDALASLVFAIIVIDAARALGVRNRAQLLATTTVAGAVAAACLAVVYLLIGYMGATRKMAPPCFQKPRSIISAWAAMSC